MTSLDVALASVTRLGFDTSPFIYFIERNPVYLDVVRTPDAIQIAAALEATCEAFVTNDNGLKRVTELQVLTLDELTL